MTETKTEGKTLRQVGFGLIKAAIVGSLATPIYQVINQELVAPFLVAILGIMVLGGLVAFTNPKQPIPQPPR